MGQTLMRLTRLLPIMIVAACLALTGSIFAADPVHSADTPVADAAHAVDTHGGAHAERGLIDFKWQEAVYTIIVFGIFFVVLSVFVWPKILAALQAREDKVRGDLRNAEEAAKEASATLASYKQQLAEAQKQAQQIVDESRGAASKVAAQLKDEAQAQITQMKDRAEADINAAKERAVSDIYEQGAALATQVAGQILRREINAADQSSLIKESIDKLRSAGQN